MKVRLAKGSRFDFDWTCHVSAPVLAVIYAAQAVKAKELLAVAPIFLSA
jgi:hypothetical protein